MTTTNFNDNVGGHVYQPYAPLEDTPVGAPLGDGAVVETEVTSIEEERTTSSLSPLTYTDQERGPVAYATSLNHPLLPEPDDLENVPTDRPLEPLTKTQREVINATYDSYVQKGVDEYINAHPNLTQAQKDALQTAAKTGVIAADIAGIFEEITTQATQKTIETYNLNPAWTHDTTDPVALTPLSMDKIPSANTGMDLVDQITQNVTQIYDDLRAAAQKVLDSLGKGEDTATITQFLKAVGEAIQKLKAQLRELQLADIEQQESASQGKFSAIADKEERAEENRKQMEELREKQQKAKEVSGIMKIVGPIVSALSTVAGALIAVATLGIGTPAAVAVIAIGITLGIAMTAYSIADGQLGLTQDLMKAFNDWIEDMTPVPPNTEADQKATKLGIVVAIAALAVVAIVLLAVLSGGSAAVNVATQTTTQVVKVAVAEGIKQLLIQMLMMFVMSSNALPEYLGEVMKEAGMSKDAIMAVQIVAMVLVMLLFVGAMAKSGKSALQKMAEQTGTVVQSSTAAATTATRSALRQSVDEIVQSITDAIQETINKLKDLIKALQKMLPQGAIDRANVVLDGTIEFVHNHRGIFFAIAQASPSVAQGVGGVIQGLLLVDISKILKAQGATLEAQQLIQEFIQMLDKLLTELLDGATNAGDAIIQAAKDFVRLYTSNSSSNLAQATILGNQM